MNVASLRYTRRINLGNYEFSELSIESVPDDGQTAESLLYDTKQFVEGNLPLSKGAPVSNGNGNGKPASNGNGKAETPEKPTDDSPKKRSSANGNGKKRGRGRPPKAATDAKKAIRYALESENMEELLDRFNDARELAGALDLDDWEDAIDEFRPLYRELNSPDEDEDVVNEVIAAFKAETTAIAEKRRNESD